MCEQFKFRREISGDNPGPGWLSSTGNLELGDSCGPRGGAAAPSNRTERRERPEPTLASRGKDLKIPYTHTHTHTARPRAYSPKLLFLWGRAILHEFGW